MERTAMAEIERPRGRVRTVNPAGEPDLRRRSTAEMIDRLLERAGCLPAGDLALLRAVYLDRHSAVELSRLLGTDPRHVRRRLRRLVARVLSPEFLFVLRHRDTWPRERARVATACILHGQALRQAAGELRRSVYTVRRVYLEVMAMMEAEGRAGAAPGRSRKAHEGRGQDA